ncbi:methyl-accepting chemotaxis protein [Clostridium neonatale]|uniref:Methyl-accepting chemotaxis protein II n=7 Tax=Clostridium neonatale TaxID=137838 RepID=A0A650M6D4_9CLOT|nr:methyl-accepting chemotaxis protein [Clostridium neonatale]CAI3538948.1 putative chemotaxis protein [Clostridium neonatale]CAI3569278.1 putative chemotaxis protein [Clostridium neonatale]CAI3591680.1 putative chemotaxis protein [Clostridium neonatale]CAI3669628.1 putative chemotaxis protein [Clostridium neonatale]SUQ40297.1 Methyl-accepting chemotaxis protein II [Clostridium neonatale]
MKWIKEKYKNYSIKKRNTFSFGAIIVMMILFMILSLSTLSNVGSLSEKIYNGSYVTNDTVWQMRVNLQALDKYTSRAIIEKDITKKNEYMKIADEHAESLKKNMNSIKGRLEEDDSIDTNLINEFNKYMDESAIERQKVVELIRNGHNEEAANMLTTTYADTIDSAREVLKKIGDNTTASAEEFLKKSDRITLYNFIFTVAVGAVIIVFSIWIMKVINSILIEGIQSLRKISLNLNEGKLETDNTYISNDEIGQVISEMNESITLLKSYVDDEVTTLNTLVSGNLDIELNKDIDYRGQFKEIQTSFGIIIDTLNDIFKNMAESSKSIAEGSEDIHTTTEIISEGSMEQAGAVEELLASFTEISDQVKENAKDIEKTEEYLESTKVIVDEGNSKMDTLRNSMNDINEAAQQVSQVTETIDDIASQVNLLALNAAIEAARAGESGKGFAVVAEEVRKLAEEVKIAAGDTREIIEHAISKAGEGSMLANETAESLHIIVKNVVRTTELSKKVSEVSNSQSIAIAQMVEGVNQIADVVEKNSSTLEEITNSTNELSRQATRVDGELARYKVKK